MYQKRVVNRKIWMVVYLTLCICLPLTWIAGVAGATSQTDLPTVYSDSGKPSVLNITIHSGESFQVELDAVSGTGYAWEVVYSSLRMLSVVSKSKRKLSNEGISGPERTTFVLQSNKALSGNESVSFLLRRYLDPPEKAIANVTCNVKITD